MYVYRDVSPKYGTAGFCVMFFSWNVLSVSLNGVIRVDLLDVVELPHKLESGFVVVLLKVHLAVSGSITFCILSRIWVLWLSITGYATNRGS